MTVKRIITLPERERIRKELESRAEKWRAWAYSQYAKIPPEQCGYTFDPEGQFPTDRDPPESS